MASPPAALISSTTIWAAVVALPVPSTEPPRSFTTTRAPRRASSSACERPRPPPAPVTIATLPSNPRSAMRRSVEVDLGALRIHRGGAVSEGSAALPRPPVEPGRGRQDQVDAGHGGGHPGVALGHGHEQKAQAGGGEEEQGACVHGASGHQVDDDERQERDG